MAVVRRAAESIVDSAVEGLVSQEVAHHVEDASVVDREAGLDEVMADGLSEKRFPSARRAVQEPAAFPRDTSLVVPTFTLPPEPGLVDRGFEGFGHDHVGE